jgi:tetratricopeptide (TPR) repeat protein
VRVRFPAVMVAWALAGGITWAQQSPLPAGAQDPDASPAQAAAPQGSRAGTVAPALASAEDKIADRAYDAARPMVLAYLQQHPGDARALFDLGYIEDSTGQADRAEADYRKAIAADPKQFEARAGLGLLLAQEGKGEQADQELQAATSLEPASHDVTAKAQVWRSLAQLQAPNDPAAAKASLLKALQLTPGQSTPADLLLTAQIAERSGDAETAETAYRRVLATQPDSAAATAGLAHLLTQQKQYAQAEPLLRAALEKNPNDAALTTQLASVLAGEGKMSEALAALEKLHALEPANSSVSRMLGDAYLQASDPGKAEPIFAAALQSAPADRELLNDEGQSLILEKRFAEAVPVLRRAVQADAGDTEAWSGLAYAYTQLHQPSEVLQALSMRSKTATDTPATLFLWATAYDTLRDSRRAAEYYRKFLDTAKGRFPDEEWQAKHRLVTLGNAH